MSPSQGMPGFSDGQDFPYPLVLVVRSAYVPYSDCSLRMAMENAKWYEIGTNRASTGKVGPLQISMHESGSSEISPAEILCGEVGVTLQFDMLTRSATTDENAVEMCYASGGRPGALRSGNYGAASPDYSWILAPSQHHRLSPSLEEHVQEICSEQGAPKGSFR